MATAAAQNVAIAYACVANEY